MPFALVATECTDELLGVRYMAAVVCSLTCYPDVTVKVKVNFVMILTFLCQDSVTCKMCCGQSCTSCSIQKSERAVVTQE